MANPNKSVGDRWFSVDQDGTMQFHDTEDQARDNANESLKEARANAVVDGEWTEDVENIGYGKFIARCREVFHYSFTDYEIKDIQ